MSKTVVGMQRKGWIGIRLDVRGSQQSRGLRAVQTRLHLRPPAAAMTSIIGAARGVLRQIGNTAELCVVYWVHELVIRLHVGDFLTSCVHRSSGGTVAVPVHPHALLRIIGWRKRVHHLDWMNDLQCKYRNTLVLPCTVVSARIKE